MQDSYQIREQINPLEDRLMQLREAWDNKLVFPLSELGKRYLRRDFNIVVECFAHKGQFGNGKRFTLAMFSKGQSGAQFAMGMDSHLCTRGDEVKFPVLIESVQVMNDAERIIFGIAPSVVWLHFLDEVQDQGICDPLYFSLVSGQFVFLGGHFSEYREFDRVFRFSPVLSTGEVPSDMIETRPQMMDDLAAQDATPQRNDQALVIINSPLPFLRIRIGDDWIFAAFEEIRDFDVEVNDVLIGPF